MGKSNLNLPHLVTSYQSPTIPTMDPPRYLRAKHLKPRKPISAKALATGIILPRYHSEQQRSHVKALAKYNVRLQWFLSWPQSSDFCFFFWGGGGECNIWNMSIENCSLHESFMEMLSHTWRKSYYCAWKTRAIWQKMRMKHSEIENGGGLVKGYQY